MDSSNAYQMFCNLDIQLHSKSYENASRVLTLIDNDLYMAFCLPTCKDYNNTYAQSTAFYFTLGLSNHDNPVIQKESQRFIRRWSHIISSVSPLDLLGNIQALVQKNDEFPKLTYLFMPAIGNAVSLLSDDEILHNFSLIQKLYRIVLPNKQSEIPKSIWQAIGKFSPEDEITQILTKNLNVQFAPIATNLIQKDPKKFSKLLFNQASSDYLNDFLKNCPSSYKIEIDEGISRASKDCDKLGTAGFNSTCQLLGNIIHYYTYDFTKEQQDRIKNVLTKIFSFLTEEKISPNDMNSILSTLAEGTKKNLFEKEQLKKFLPNVKFTDKCPQLQITYLKAVIVCMEKEGDNTLANKSLLQVNPWFGQIYIQYLQLIEEYFFYIKEINPTLATRILWTIFHPLALEPTLAVAIVKFLLKMIPSDILDPRVDARLNVLFDSYFRIANSELNKLTLQLAKLYKYSPPVTKIDLFGKFNENCISLLTNVDPRLIKELLAYGLLQPSKRHVLLTVMQSWPRCYAEFAVPLTNLLYMYCKVIGISADVDSCFSRCGLQKVEISDEIVSFEELRQMYAEVDGPIDQSDFGTLLMGALDALSMICTDAHCRKKVHQNHIAKVAVIASYLILLSPKQVLNLLSRLQGFRLKNMKSGSADQKDSEKVETNSAVNGYNEAFRIIESAKIPIKYSIDVVQYANIRFGGYNEAVKHFPKHIEDALSKSRIVADTFKGNLKQPLQPLKTFLSLVGLKDHNEWVSVCQQVIPPQEWKIRSSDAKTIDSLKNLSEETKRIIHERLINVKNNPKSVSQITESYEIRSAFFRIKSPLHIPPGLNVHPKDNKATKAGSISITQLPPPEAKKAEKSASEESNNNNNNNNEQEEAENTTVNDNCGTLSDVISFLWHSNLELPESIKPEDLENLALANPRNVKMLIGFFSWANSHNYKINLTKWENKIFVKRYTPSWLFAIAMFASNIHCSFMQIPASIIQVLQKCLTSFGYPAISKTSLAYGYYHLTGVKWLVVRNIISIDPSFFSEFPLIVVELTRNMDTFKKYFDELDTQDYTKVNFDSFIGINDILFNPTRDEMIQTLPFPTNRAFHSRMYSFKEVSIIPKQIVIPKELLESIINALQKAKNVTYNYFAFFMNIKMTNEQFARVHDIFFKGRKSSDMTRKFMLPSLFVSETGKSAYMQDEAIRFYSRKPPSLTRAFFRSLLCRFAPPVNQDLITKIESKLIDVFPELCYCGFSKSGIRMWPDSLPLSKLRLGFIDGNIGASLLNDMKVPSKEALTIYSLLSKLPDNELTIAQPWATKGMIRDEMARVLLETATSTSSNASFASSAANVVCDTIGIDNAMILIASKDLLKRPNFLCAIVAFEVLLKKAQKDNSQAVVEFIKMLKNPETNLIENEERKKLFMNINSDDSISELIHPSSS